MREYRSGDELRRIHWPSTARTGQMMVRQDEQPGRRRALVLLDNRASSHAGTGGGGSLEWSVSATASVATHLVAHGLETYLATADEASEPLAPLGASATRSRPSPSSPPAPDPGRTGSSTRRPRSRRPAGHGRRRRRSARARAGPATHPHRPRHRLRRRPRLLRAGRRAAEHDGGGAHGRRLAGGRRAAGLADRRGVGPPRRRPGGVA
ncbi:DUF58 domain-containing protein [Janibacter melonis]|uniref:DUF58 domain-containing protein n=1 Tax=Janibacter melonis TaxID=262209 RepID=UPI00355761AA